MSVLYNSSIELTTASSDDDDDEDEDEDDHKDNNRNSKFLPIRQLKILPSLVSTGSPCMFILLGSVGLEIDYLKSIIVGFNVPSASGMS